MATISEALAIAIQHHQAGRLQAAEQIYRQVLAVEPNHAEAIHFLGLVAHQIGKHDAAIEYMGRSIELNGTKAVFHNNLGAVYHALRRIPEAAACYRRALELRPDDADAHSNLGVLLSEQGKLDEAVACYLRALELKPGHSEAHSNLGNALKGQGKLGEAVPCFLRALELKPDYAEAQSNLGATLNELGQLDEAIACYRRLLELKPDFANAHYNLGVLLNDQGQVDEAVVCYRRALELRPDDAEAHNNLGVAFKAQAKLGEAVTCYRHALRLKPDCADAHWNQSVLSLLTGDFERGWPEYEWRWKTNQFQRRDFSQARWDGQPLEGRTILLYAEQGLGDGIQFVRYAALVKQRGGAVIVECQRPLLSLLKSCAGIDRLVGHGGELPVFDVQAPLLSLPGIFHTSLRDIPAAVPYLFADRGLVDRWRRELGDIADFKIGVAWQGSPTFPGDRDRSIPLGCFEPLARCSGVRLLSLQKHDGVEQLHEVADRFPVIDLGSRLDEASGAFMDTAAVMMNLDLVVTSDTAVAHLAGALGVAVWVAIPFVPDWRWLLDRSDSPWYPTMRLFRQERRGDWQGVFRRIEVALGEGLRKNSLCRL